MPEIASRIEKLYYLDCEDNAIHSFENVLRLNENNFQEFRYLFEREKRKIMYSTDVARVVRVLKCVCEDN